MKAITLWQPWASLIACGAKKYETRSWSTSYRGPIAIHAAAVTPSTTLRHIFPLGAWSYHPDYSAKCAFMKDVYQAIFPEKVAQGEGFEYLDKMDSLPRGAIIATAELVECWEIQPSNGRGVNYKDVFIHKRDLQGLDGFTWIEGNERLFGDWTPGRYAWELQNVVMLPEPIPAKGAQGLWNWEG